MWPLNLMDDLEKLSSIPCQALVKIGDVSFRVNLKFDIWPWIQYDTFCILHQALCIISKPSRNSNWSSSPETLNSGQNRRIFCPDIEIWWMFLQKQKCTSSPLLNFIKLCVSYQSHQWNQTGVTVQKLSIWVKIGDFLSRVTSKFDGWYWNTIGHLFCATSSVVHYFVAIG